MPGSTAVGLRDRPSRLLLDSSTASSWGAAAEVFQARPIGRLTYGAHQITFAMKYDAVS